MPTIPTSHVDARVNAEVARRLAALGVTPTDPEFATKFAQVKAMVLAGASDQRADQVDITLPSLENETSAEIIEANVRALSVVYVAAQLEELKFFATIDKITEQFMTGMLPVTRGSGGQALYSYIKEAPTRLFNEAERRGLYARAFGFAQGAVDEPLPNREFNDSWIRFLSGVSLINRQSVYERAVTTNQEVTKTARDLAVNLSLHGYGVAHFAAVELQQLIKALLALGADREILAAYGARDVWQLVERVSAMFLGGSVNSVRARTLAESGKTIILWLADRSVELSRPYGVMEFRVVPPEGSPNPSTPDMQQLLDACDRWLAVTGAGDQAITRYSEPVAISTQPTVPNHFSLEGATRAASDMLNQIPNLGVTPQA